MDKVVRHTPDLDKVAGWEDIVDTVPFEVVVPFEGDNLAQALGEDIAQWEGNLVVDTAQRDTQ